MYQYHPTLIQQPLDFFFYSTITQSAPEQVIRVWVIASEGAHRDGRYKSMKIYAVAESLRGFGGIVYYQFIFASGYALAYLPSSEPDAGERRIPYLNTVFKPIKDGIKSFIRGVTESFANCVKDYQSNSEGGSRGENGEDGYISDEEISNLIKAMFGHPLITSILLILIIITAVSVIISPFTSLVGGLIFTVASFIFPIIINSIGGSGNSKKDGPSISISFSSVGEWLFDILKISGGIAAAFLSSIMASLNSATVSSATPYAFKIATTGAFQGTVQSIALWAALSFIFTFTAVLTSWVAKLFDAENNIGVTLTVFTLSFFASICALMATLNLGYLWYHNTLDSQIAPFLALVSLFLSVAATIVAWDSFSKNVNG